MYFFLIYKISPFNFICWFIQDVAPGGVAPVVPPTVPVADQEEGEPAGPIMVVDYF